jgi:uncharacterized protein YjiS (DUF1127 family)
MTMLTTIPPTASRAFSREVATGSRQENASNQKSGARFGSRSLAWRITILLARGRRLINRFLAAVIARHERHAARIALHRLDDRHLKDIAIARAEIDSRLEELAQMRARMQQPGWH